jgi:hypothetical protein
LRAWLSLGLAGLMGCAALKPRPADPGLFLLPPSEAGTEISLSQSLAFSKGEQHFEALAAIELDASHLSLVGLGPLGNRMLALRYDGEHLEQERDPSLPPELPLQLILRDIELAYWPAEALRKRLGPEGWQIEEAALARTLVKNGAEVVRILYGGADRWRSPLSFEHRGLGYRLDIHPIKEEE